MNHKDSRPEWIKAEMIENRKRREREIRELVYPEDCCCPAWEQEEFERKERLRKERRRK